MGPLRVVRTVTLSSSPAELWPLLADTDRINRWTGSPPVRPRPIDDAAAARRGARFFVETESAGIRTSYDEYPYEWEVERRFHVLRRFRGGPFESLDVTFDLSPAGRGTLLAIAFEVATRTLWARPLAWAAITRAAMGFERLSADLDASVRAHTVVVKAPPRPKPDDKLLEGIVDRIVRSGVPSPLARRLAEHVAKGDDADVTKMRPFELADAWGLPRHDVLRACLHAVPAGLVELRWGIVCPSCRTASEEVPGLDALGAVGHCQLCDISFELELDRAVEATFHPHPGLRAVADVLFCIGGPGRTPHVFAQVVIGDDDRGELPVPPDEGRYRLFARGGAVVSLDVGRSAPALIDVKLLPTTFSEPAAIVAPGGKVRVENVSGEGRHVKLERLAYADSAATAHLVTTLDEFRSLFSKEIVKRETPVKVSRVAVLFSDLTGSTALYAAVGDAKAFRFVDDHFDVLRKVVDAEDGTIVKTMGDAVMAAFPDARRAARAALAAIRAFEVFRLGRAHGELVGLKVGIYDGPCYVVSANGTLDYFGQTVNVASRVQHLAESGELVLSRETLRELDPNELAGAKVSEPFEARVKGVREPLELVRIAT